MSASQYRYTCAQLGICQARNPAGCTRCSYTDEQRDAPPITPEACMAWLRTGLLCLAVLLAFVLATVAGSALLHSFDAEIRHAVGQVWGVVQRLFWATQQVYG